MFADVPTILTVLCVVQGLRLGFGSGSGLVWSMADLQMTFWSYFLIFLPLPALSSFFGFFAAVTFLFFCGGERAGKHIPNPQP